VHDPDGVMITVFASASARAFVLRHPRSTLARLSMQRIGQVSMGETTSLNGTVRRVLFRADTGYTVATLDCSPEGQKAVVITSNHCLALVQPGERLAVVGRWTEHQKFGAQLQVESTSGAEVGATPSTAEGMEELLSSKAIKGVGPKLAAALVQALPPLSRPCPTSHASRPLATRTRARALAGVWREHPRRAAERGARGRAPKHAGHRAKDPGPDTDLCTAVGRQPRRAGLRTLTRAQRVASLRPRQEARGRQRDQGEAQPVHARS
jgi:hypothetical protein